MLVYPKLYVTLVSPYIGAEEKAPLVKYLPAGTRIRVQPSELTKARRTKPEELHPRLPSSPPQTDTQGCPLAPTDTQALY